MQQQTWLHNFVENSTRWVETERAVEEVKALFPGWPVGSLRNMRTQIDDMHDVEDKTNRLLADHLSDNADVDAMFGRTDFPPPDLDAVLPVAKGFHGGVMCGTIGILEPMMPLFLWIFSPQSAISF